MLKFDKAKRSLNNISILILIYVIFQNFENVFQRLDYILIHIDERQLIDDIYNLAFFNDEFDRFLDINNQLIKKILILITELIIGGNLDYGRLWNNIFVIPSAPLFLVSNTAPIIFERVLVIIIFYSSIFYFAKNFVNKNLWGIFVIFSLSAPKVFYILNPPKPDVLILLVLVLSSKFIFIDKNLRRGFIFLGIAIGVKLTALFPAALLGLYLIFPLKILVSLKEIFKSILWTLVGVCIAQPAILIPYTPITKRIVNQVSAAVLYDQSDLSSTYFPSLKGWILELENHFLVNKFILIVFFGLIIFETFINIFKKQHLIETYFLATFCILVIFYISFISRVWLYYLIIPYMFMNFYFFSVIAKNKNNLTKFIFILYLFIGISGMYSNYINLNSKFDTNEYWVENLEQAIEFISNEYNEIEKPYKKVYWDPDYYLPKQNLTYQSDFRVMENWDRSKNTEHLFHDVDFIVTRDNYVLDEKINLKVVGDLNIYYLNR